MKIPALVFTVVLLIAGDLFANEGDKEPMLLGVVNRDINVINSSDVHVCFDSLGSTQVTIDFENLGSDTIFNIQFGWFLATDNAGIQNWTGFLPPNSTESVTFSQLNFSNSGVFNIVLWADMGGYDANPQNDTISYTLTIDPPFELDVLSDTSVCQNANVFMELPSGYQSYEWSGGQTSQNLMVENSGLFIVTVTNTLGCQAVDSMLIQQYASPSALLPDDTVLCDSVIWVPEVSEKFQSYSWGLGDTVSNITISTEGTYVLDVIDSLGCSYTDTLNVQYAAPPTPTVPAQVFICDGDSAILSVSSNFSSFQWSTGSTGNSISTSSPGLFYVTVTGASGCFGFDTVQVLVNPLPSVTFVDSVMCNLEPFVLDVGWYSSFQWSTGDTIQHPVVSSPGWYGVSVTDINGCKNSDSIEVENVNISVSLGPDTTICEGDGSFIILGRYDYYLWNDGHNGPSQYIGEEGTYSVTVNSNGCSVSDEVIVSEIPYPLANFTQVVAGNTVDFISGANSASSIDWNFGDGNYSTLPHPSHSYSTFGLFDVTLITSNFCGVDSVTKTVSIFPLAVNSISGDKDFVVYPSFVSDVVHIKLNSSNLNTLKYALFDASGKLLLIKEEQVLGMSQVFNLNVSSYATGSYFLRLLGDDELLGVKQFIKN